MKKLLSIVLLACAVIFACTKSNQPNVDGLDTKKSLTIPLKKAVSATTTSSTCGGSYSGTYTAPGTNPIVYTYALQALDISCAADGATITISGSAIDVPNRFTIVDQNNQFVAASGSGSYSYWVGNNCIGPNNSCFNGPWGGGNIPAPYSSGQTTFTFTKVAGKTYSLKVEGYIPDATYQHRQDAWTANVSCTCAPVNTCPNLNDPTCDVVLCPGDSRCRPCSGGGSYSSSYTAPGSDAVLYTYPLQPLSNLLSGYTYKVTGSAIDVPNRFTIVDQNNQFVAASGSGSYSYWVGNNCSGVNNSCFSGPWGGSNIPVPYNSGQTVFTFVAVAGKTYSLRIEGYIPNGTYQRRQDAWTANVACNN